MKNIITLLLFIFLANSALGQQVTNDSLQAPHSSKFKYESLVIPAAFITYGVIGLKNPQIQEWDQSINTKFAKQGKHKGMVDEYLQYTPIFSVYALNALGLEGKYRFKERTVILGTAALIAGVPVNILKKKRIVIRPNGKNKFSFPSGHTALAFLGAEFLHQEYKDVSVWYSISGYLVATVTGAYRIYNNNHWPSDVVAGAGIGILATKIAYWVYPFIEKTFFNKPEGVAGIVMPYYNGRELGLGISMLW